MSDDSPFNYMYSTKPPDEAKPKHQVALGGALSKSETSEVSQFRNPAQQFGPDSQQLSYDGTTAPFPACDSLQRTSYLGQFPNGGVNWNYDFSIPGMAQMPHIGPTPPFQPTIPLHTTSLMLDSWALPAVDVDSGFNPGPSCATGSSLVPTNPWPPYRHGLHELSYLNINSPSPLSVLPIATSQLLAIPAVTQTSSWKSGDIQNQQTFQESNAAVDCEPDVSNTATAQQKAHTARPTVVCYGMIVGLGGTVKRADLDETTRCPVALSSPDSFTGTEDSNLRGEVSPESRYLTAALLQEPDFELQVTCTVSVDPPKVLSSGKRLRVSGAIPKCTLDIVLYGPPELADAIYTFIQECNDSLEDLQDEQRLYLQDPIGCDRDVPYQNPQKLPPLDSTSVVLTSQLSRRLHDPLDLEDIEPRPELLELLDSQHDLLEALQPSAITTSLERHQKQALTFMQQREQGWAFDGSRPDIWEAVESGAGHTFVNRISDARQSDEPPPFYGGIIADPMGLGKTLTMIALVASDAHRPEFDDPSATFGFLKEESCGVTLVIVPPALLGTWEDELALHVLRGSLPWRLHHGKSRLRDPAELNEAAIVLTTYHTVSMEGRTAESRESSMLFTTRWRRLVLDEAHLIRNSDSLMARAVCSLNSVSRWAVTGTPIQNHINDLAALLKFLGVYPYSEKRVFDVDIAHTWKLGNAEEAVKRLKRLAGCLLLRRPKGIIQLPERRDRAQYVEFDPQERKLYDAARTQVIARIDESLSYGTRAAPSFVSILQQIEAMRMICDLGLLYPNRHEMPQLDTAPNMDDWHTTAQRGFNLRFDMGPVQCQSCHFALDPSNNPLGEADLAKPLFARCLRFICSSCVQKASRMPTCGHVPPCPIASVSTSPSSLEEPPISITLKGLEGSAYRPTKVTALVDDIRCLPSDVKCVVFSTWRMTLDVVAAGLKAANISAIRFDGKVPQRERQRILEKFRQDPSIRVMLLTLSCGAVGLTLTVASRAYLMEPHWNPTIEDQALARVHRIGQKQKVTTIRFYVRDSFEENVVKSQQSKRDLASILLAPSGATISDGVHLERLRRLI
ncbi:SNF2 family N-terminal domain-containing protein [Cercophora newfieldiana]|uniref:SNF2 family N-terminal domain-containing protein n=1 Tax=Cercophora newfieldiana TaxID=92897 RepID=A0AA39YTQ2_9PEZI|nr:SNF2 family N-terminal domain-containing protein [Cercophora newfieldiana]